MEIHPSWNNRVEDQQTGTGMHELLRPENPERTPLDAA